VGSCALGDAFHELDIASCLGGVVFDGFNCLVVEDSYALLGDYPGVLGHCGICLWVVGIEKGL
jgi:hypothetical protein